MEPEGRSHQIKVAAVQISATTRQTYPARLRPERNGRPLHRKGRQGWSTTGRVPRISSGRISVPGPQTERISKAAAAGRIYVIVGCWEVFGTAPCQHRTPVRQGGQNHRQVQQGSCGCGPVRGEPPWSKPPKGKDADWFIRNDPEWKMKRGEEFPVFDLDSADRHPDLLRRLVPETFRILSLNGADSWCGSTAAEARWRTLSSSRRCSRTRWR